MAAANNAEQCLYQNLTDAKCPEEQRALCMELASQGRPRQMLPILREHRKELLRIIHEHQKALDSLDYLMFQTEKTGKQV